MKKSIDGRISVGQKEDIEKGVYYNLYVKQRDENIRLKQTISQLVEELTESNKRSEVSITVLKSQNMASESYLELFQASLAQIKLKIR